MKDDAGERAGENGCVGRNEAVLQDAAQRVTLARALAAADKDAGRRGDVLVYSRIVVSCHHTVGEHGRRGHLDRVAAEETVLLIRLAGGTLGVVSHRFREYGRARNIVVGVFRAAIRVEEAHV